MALIEQQVDAATRLGITPRALRDWMKEPGFPDCSTGYDIKAILAWRQQHERKGSETSDQKSKIKLGQEVEKLKQMQIRTKKEQLTLEATEGTLLPRKAVEQTAAVLLSSLADWSEQLPDLVAGNCCRKCSKKVAARIKSELDERREQMADDLKSLAPS